MEYSCRTAGGTVEATLTEKLTFTDMNSFRGLIKEMQGAGAGNWVADLTQLGSLDSAGLGLLLRLKAAADKDGHSLRLRIAPNGQVRQLMDVAKFQQMIPFES